MRRTSSATTTASSSPRRSGSGGAGGPLSSRRRARMSCVARCSPFAAPLASCFTIARRLVMRRFSPFSFASTSSSSARSTSAAMPRARFGRPRGLPDWPGRKRVARLLLGSVSPLPSGRADGGEGNRRLRQFLRNLRQTSLRGHRPSRPRSAPAPLSPREGGLRLARAAESNVSPVGWRRALSPVSACHRRMAASTARQAAASPASPQQSQ